VVACQVICGTTVRAIRLSPYSDSNHALPVGIRKEYGRTKWHSKGQAYERKNPEFLSFDADSSDRNQLDAAIGTWDGNLEASWDPTLERLDAGRSSARSGDLRTLGIHTRRRVTH
jgi:hypothetical protein